LRHFHNTGSIHNIRKSALQQHTSGRHCSELQVKLPDGRARRNCPAIWT